MSSRTRKADIRFVGRILAGGLVLALLPVVRLSADTVTQTLPAGWTLVSVPLLPVPPDAASVFGAVSPLNLYDYVAGQTLAVGEGLRDLAPGRADWILLTTPTTVQVTGSLVSTTTPFNLPIEPGWNLIATPWLTPVQWADAQVAVVSSGNTLPLSQAVAQNWVEGTLHTVAHGSAGALEPWGGYLVFSNVTGALVFAPPPSGTTTASAASAPKKIAGPSLPVENATLRRRPEPGRL